MQTAGPPFFSLLFFSEAKKEITNRAKPRLLTKRQQHRKKRGFLGCQDNNSTTKSQLFFVVKNYGTHFVFAS